MQDGTESMSEGDENMTGNWMTQPGAESPSGSQASNSSPPKPALAPIETSKIMSEENDDKVTITEENDEKVIMAEENDDKVIVDSTIIHTRRLSHDFQDAPETADTPDTGLLTQEETDSLTPRRTRKALQFSDNDDDNDHGDNQSVGSSESVSDSSLSSQEGIMLTLSERRLQNDERNAKYLSYLESKYEKVVPKAKPKRTDKEVDEEDVEEESLKKEIGPPRGMLIKMNTSIDLQTKDSTPTPTNASKSLQTRYPHRESQIRLLTSLLSATMTQASRYSPDPNLPAYVPAPIFVTGPSGTGKTAICRDVVDALDKTVSGVTSAYVNCAIIEPSSIDRLVSSAFSQLKPIELEENQKSRRRKRKHKSVSTKEVPAKVHAVSNTEDAVTGDSQENGKHTTTTEELEGPKVQKSAEQATTDAPIDTEVPNQDEEIDEQDAELNKRIQPGRRAKADNILTGSAKVSRKNVKQIGSMVAKSNAAAGKVESSWETHAAVVALGRALKPYYGRESKSCAFLVLDHAERLLSLSMKKDGKQQTNYLAELLLLPKVMELNLTIIVITNNCVLDSSRLNNIVSAGKSHATLLNGLHPYRIKFTAYKGIDVFKKILRVAGVLRLIVGDEKEDAPASAFQAKVKESFLNTLVQSLSGSTRDIREFVRLGRSLWPFYIKPLHPSCIEKTMESIDKSTSISADSEVVEKAILTHLDQKILPHISGFLNDGLFSLSLDSPMVIDPNANTEAKEDAENDQPYLRTCLLLAAFICQNNKADQDKRIFSIQGTGKRRGRNRVHDGASENVAFGSTLSEQQQLKKIRPHPFLLERMLSIFVTLVGLNPASEDWLIDTGDRDDFLQSLGSTFLYTNLAQLRDFGHLHKAGFTGSLKTEQINLSSTKYWCSLTRDEAMVLATKVDIPLATYLL